MSGVIISSEKRQWECGQGEDDSAGDFSILPSEFEFVQQALENGGQ